MKRAKQVRTKSKAVATKPRAASASSKKRGGSGRVQKNAVRGAKPKRRNSTAAAEGMYEKFHGRPADVVVDVREEIQEHGVLAGLGKLVELVIVSREGNEVEVSGFEGALLCANEAGTQLYIRGGDQSVNLRAFGITESVHEQEWLGFLSVVAYDTKKDHLGDEGGDAIYVHEFDGETLPGVNYDTRNKLLSIWGGSYEIPAEGIAG